MVSSTVQFDLDGERVSATVRYVAGHTAVLAQAELLQDLAARCGQPGDAHFLPYVLAAAASPASQPVLLLYVRAETPADCAACRPFAAVLLFQRLAQGQPTGVFSTADAHGGRNLLAPLALRSQVAAHAAGHLLHEGAHAVLLSFLCDPIAHQPAPQASVPGAVWTSSTRTVLRRLPLGATYDATLARLGKRTRTHLRYYRRRFLETIPSHFLPDVRGLLTEEEYLELAARSAYAPGPAQSSRLYRAAVELPGGFLMGLRSAAGEWISLCGGWRHHDTTVLHHQLNPQAHPRLSVGTVMRSFFLEHESGRASRVIFHGGVSHSIQHALEPETARDLIVLRRPSLQAILVRRPSPADPQTPSVDWPARLLLDRELAWHPLAPGCSELAPVK